MRLAIPLAPSRYLYINLEYFNSSEAALRGRFLSPSEQNQSNAPKPLQVER